MAVKKSALYSRLWESCNTLRSKGGMDATQYKDYVLIVLFMKVITDKYYGKSNSVIEVPEDANFNTMKSLKGKKHIGEAFNIILAKIAEENDLQNIIDVVDFNDENKLGKGKDMVDALTGLVEIFEDPELDFSNNKADDDDILGDAYEYFMKKFASEAGKSKGQFYTPSEVSRIIAKLIKINQTQKSPVYVYDMTCGSGSLLLKAGAEASDDVKVALYGQEKDNSTAGLAMMNMFLHGNATAQIKVGNTLTNPLFLEGSQLRTFDFCVANPPFSVKKWNTDLDNYYDRFRGFGMPPENCGDYAFLLHMLKSMDPDHGRGAIILPHGVLSRPGQEGEIRRRLIKCGCIEGIIGLPNNLFYGTGIPACIFILDKENALKRKDIFMIDASKNFIKEGNKNKLREEDIKKITDIYLNRIEEDKFSRIVSIQDIENEDYNLNIGRYINSNDEVEVQDIKAHLLGGIPEKDVEKYCKYWDVAPNLKRILFKENSNKGYLDLVVSNEEITNVISNSEEMREYSELLKSKLEKFQNNSRKILEEINNCTRVKSLIEIISENLLQIFNDDKLIDKYDAYEYLMEYYDETMKDDLYLIVDSGWIPTLIYTKDKKGNIKKNDFDSDLLPKSIIIDEYFSKENNNLKSLIEELEDLVSRFYTCIEDNTGDVLLFNGEDKITEKLIKELISTSTKDELNILNELLRNLNSQKELKKKIKICQDDLNNKIISKYNDLDIETSKKLLINKKWYKSILNKFNQKLDDIYYQLSNNVTNEAENYQYTLSTLINQTNTFESKVLEDLKRMGY